MHVGAIVKVLEDNKFVDLLCQYCLLRLAGESQRMCIVEAHTVQESANLVKFQSLKTC